MGEKNRSKSFAFEGLDGAGKTTHINRLAESFEGLGVRVAVLSSPSKTGVGKIMRAHIGDMPPEKKNVLFTYDIERTQRRIPENADLVLWDRHLDSVKVSNTDDAELVVEERAGRITRPDQVMFLDLPPAVSWERESQNTDHPLDPEWIKTKHERYQRLRDKEPGRFTVVDASQPLDAVYDELFGHILKEVQPAIDKNARMYDLLLSTDGLVNFVLDNPFEVKPNVYLPMFVNFKKTWSNPEVRGEIVKNLAGLIGQDFDWICGLESGGSYYAVTAGNELGKPVSLYRKSAKGHGTADQLVGEMPPKGARVALVDDVFATGQSASRVVEQMQKAGCKPELFTVFSYSNDQEMRARLGAPATALTYFKGIREEAKRRGMLTDEESKIITREVDSYRNTIFS